MESISTAISKKISIPNLLFLGILAIGCFLRFYKLPYYLTFLGDEGRDVAIARRIIVDLHPALIGPQTSIGNMYLGPFYYYLIAPALALFSFSPVGPAAMIASLGVVTIALLYLFVSVWFNRKTALVASFLYAISPLTITYSRSSWNPNIMPLLSLLVIWSIWLFWSQRKFKYLCLGTVFLSLALQSHYLALLLFPLYGLFWFLTWLNSSQYRPQIYKTTFVSICIFLTSLLPQIAFDLRHDFLNARAFTKFFTVRQETVNLKPYKSIPRLFPISKQLFASSLGTQNAPALYLILILSLVATFISYSRYPQPVTLISLWATIGALGLGLYKQHLYDHYFGFLFPLPFIFLSLFVSQLLESKSLRGFGILFVLALTYTSLSQSQLWYPPNLQLSRTEAISDFVISLAQNQEFNFGLIAKRNYDAGYRYFFDIKKARVAKIENKLTSQLIIVCEDPICEPINHPNAEIANFGWAKIEASYQTPWGTQIFKLVHAQ